MASTTKPFAHALSKAATGQNQFEVTVARGNRTKVLEETHIVYHLRDELITDPEAQKTDFERLMEGEYLEACKNWQGPVKMVRKGNLVAELKHAEIELGCDVFGEEVNLEGRGGISLEVGDNVTLSEDGTKAIADLYGYAGLLAGLVIVVPPIWMSSDRMEARFIFYSTLKAPPVPTEEDLNELLEMKWIEYGVMEKQVELICQRLAEKQALPTTVPLVQGSPEIHGGDAQIKYSFDPFELIKWNQLQSLLSAKAPEAIQHNLTELYDGEEECTMRFKAVRPGEVVAEKLPATAGVAGRDIQGEEVAPNEGNDVPLEVGEGLAIDDDGLRAKAEHHGYVALRWDIETNVLSPLWISPTARPCISLTCPRPRTRDSRLSRTCRSCWTRRESFTDSPLSDGRRSSRNWKRASAPRTMSSSSPRERWRSLAQTLNSIGWWRSTTTSPAASWTTAPSTSVIAI